MWELDYKESWAPKNWCFWTVVLEKTLESPLDCKEIQPVHPKGNQSWVFIGRTDVAAETPMFWPPDATNWLIWKDPGAGKVWRCEEKRTTEDEMVWWHHWLNGHEFEQALGGVDGQGSLSCCSPWGCKESDTIEGLNWTEQLQVPFYAYYMSLLNPSIIQWSQVLLLFPFYIQEIRGHWQVVEEPGFELRHSDTRIHAFNQHTIVPFELSKVKS